MKALILVLSLFSASWAMACGQGAYCPGKRVIDKDNDTGRIVESFSNGKAVVAYDRYSENITTEIRKLSAAVKCANTICMNDRVVDKDNDVGTVKEVFANGQAMVAFDRYSEAIAANTRSLGKGFRCVENICRKSRVMDSDGDTGNVREVFDNGQALVMYDRYSEPIVTSFEKLGISLNCRLRQNCACRN